MTTLGRKFPRQPPAITPRHVKSVPVVKPATPRAAPGRRWVAAEPVRVVPLHYPEAAPPPSDVNLTYRGGPLLQNVRVFTIFWGSHWDRATSQTLMTGLNQFFTDIVASRLMEQLAEYGAPGKPIGPGTFLGTRIVASPAPAGSVTDSEIRGALAGWIKAKVVPRNTRNTLYIVYLEPGVVSIMGGSKSCRSFCGYHDRVGAMYYAVVPYPDCGGCRGGMETFEALTATSSHALCEAITDPVPGRGWYDDHHGEVGDVCAWSFKQVAGYTVQLAWSNAEGKCV
jgi:hypothetical protein